MIEWRMVLADRQPFAGPCASQAQSSFGIVGCINTAAAHAPTDTTIANVLMTIHIMSAPIADTAQGFAGMVFKICHHRCRNGEAQKKIDSRGGEAGRVR
jgi:hypothetical protein